MKSELLPIAAVIPTRHRPIALARTLSSLAQQSAQPSAVIVIDASDREDSRTKDICQSPPHDLVSDVIYERAVVVGAAQQRNQAMKRTTLPTIWFLDDDVVLEPECVQRMYDALQQDANLGGVNATITNQSYCPPGRCSRAVFALLDGGLSPSYAGRCFGPGLNLLPEDRDDLPDVVPVEWLNTTCTMYRRNCLPDPPFDAFFHGYSLGEDLALSLRLGKRWKLANARTARIFHDSQGGDHKRNQAALSEMELVNRHYIMTEVLGRRGFMDYVRLLVLQIYHVVGAMASSKGRYQLPAILWGKLRGAVKLACQKRPLSATNPAWSPFDRCNEPRVSDVRG